MDRNWKKEFEPLGDNVNDVWNYFKSELERGMKLYIPMCKGNSWKQKSTWSRPISAFQKEMINKKYRVWQTYQETRDSKRLQEYKKVRNCVRKETRKLEKQEQLHISRNCKSNLKLFWKQVRNKSSSISTVSYLKVKVHGEETLITDNKDKATALLDFFSTVFTKEPDSDFIELDKVAVTSEMSPLHITEYDIHKRLSNLKLNKSPGQDSIHLRVLYEVRSKICFSLKHIMELSLNIGDIPLDWKSTIITALYKKGSRTAVSNYRPVSLTCITCKLMESLVRDHLLKFFISNKLFSNHQYGFIEGRSTVLQLLYILDKWTKLLRKHLT